MPVPRAMTRRPLPAQEQQALDNRSKVQEKMRSYFGTSPEGNKAKKVVERELRAREGTLYQLLEREDVGTDTEELEQAVKQQSPSPPPPLRVPHEQLVNNSQGEHKSLHESLAAAVAANLATLKSIDTAKHNDQLHSNFSSTASSRPLLPDTQDSPAVNLWLNHHLTNNAQGLFPAVPSQPSTAPSIPDVPVIHGFDPSNQAPILSASAPASKQDDLLALLHSKVVDKLPPTISEPAHPSVRQNPEAAAAIPSAVSTFLNKTLDAQKSSQALNSKVEALNDELTKLRRQVDMERTRAKEMRGKMEEAMSRAATVEEENRRLQDIVNQCNEEVAATLRKSGEEMAQQWQAHKELQIKINEQANLQYVTTQKLQEVTNELHHKEVLVDGFRAKLREKDERLKEVVQLASVRQSSVATEDLAERAQSQKPFEHHYAPQAQQEQPIQQEAQHEVHFQHSYEQPHEQEQEQEQNLPQSFHEPQQQEAPFQHHYEQEYQALPKAFQHVELPQPQEQPFKHYYEQQQQQQQQEEVPQFRHHYEAQQQELVLPKHELLSNDDKCVKDSKMNVSGVALWEELKNEALEARVVRLEERLAPCEGEHQKDEDMNDEEVRKMLPFEIPEHGRQMLPPPTSSMRPKPKRNKSCSGSQELDVIALPTVPNSPVDGSIKANLCLSPPFNETDKSARARAALTFSASPPPPPPPCSTLPAHDDLRPISMQFEAEPAAFPGSSPSAMPGIPKKATPNRGMGTAW
eukprot:TRINITY_DN1895_c0_g1_i2.p1 TRINITY_DN1895_c0_g1~~TRINITY_DN1895_c0_g1_i2.p1  ORF type:complete len:747 (+),score=189.28 TRINITY_DN1895_c0_g1_i2:13-2253(+)